MPNWSSAAKVRQTIRAGDTVERVKSANRARILRAANCVPFFDSEEEKKLGLKINVNFGEMAVLLTNAIKQMVTAFTSNQYYFTVNLPRAPKEHQSEWGTFITNEINDIMMRGKDALTYYLLQCARWSSVAQHGVAPTVWRHEDRWKPKICPLANIRIATDTTLDFENLNWYAERVPYTPLELSTEAFNKNKNNHWNKPRVQAILKNYKEINFTDATNNLDWETDVEKMASIIRQDGGLYGSNAVPTIPLWHFYFEDDDGNNGRQWFMRVVPDAAVVRGADEDEFLWESNNPFGRSWRELMHCQFGDLSFDIPPTFAGVRGLGLLLVDPVFFGNLTKCKFLQHVFDNFNMYLRVDDPPEKARALIQEFKDLAVIRKGVSIVPANERHQIKDSLPESVMAMMKQLQVEASSSYTQQADTGTQKEQTAFETRVRAEAVNAMTAGIIDRARHFEDAFNREISRRFCLKDSTDPDVKLFQQRCRAFGIPPGWLDVNQWIVQTVTPIGMGNPTIAQAAIAQLEELSKKLPPQAQEEIHHEAVLTITKDPRKAARWAPITGATQSDATREAIGIFGTLMQAVPIPPMQSNYIDQIEALLPLLAGKIQLLTQRNNMATLEESMGLYNVLGYISGGVQKLSQDDQQKERVKKYTDALAQLSNETKSLTQRGIEASKAQANQAGGAQASEAANKLQIENATAQQRMRLEEQRFQLEQRRKNREAAAEQRRKDAAAFADIEHDKLKAMASAHNSRLKSVPSE